jgi:tetratricopeptide (TPR) repeat protein
MNKLLIIFFCCIFAIPAQSQRLKKWLTAADSAYAINDYKSAIRLYQVALTYDSTLSQAKYRIAESARVYKAYDVAIDYYKKVIVNKESLNKFPLAEFHLATIYQQYGKYTEAIRVFNSFVNNYRNTRPPGDKYLQIAKNGVEYCIKAREKTSNFALFDGLLNRIDTSGKLKINTARSDFGLVSIQDTFYYTSIRNIYRDKEQFVRRHYAEVFKAAEGMPGEPIPAINKEGQHVGDLVFNSDQTRIYYSVCENIDEYQVRCDIFYRDILNGVWGPEFKYPHNDPDFSTTQPYVGVDKLTNKEMLFFASDRLSDSLDRKDIFVSFIEGPTEFSDPMPIETINTTYGDEMSPFFDSFTQTLYYSTDGEYTYGGSDLFKVAKVGDEWINKINLGTEVNSSYNDGFLRFDSKREYAYLASDREESLLYDPELDACCYDIYRIPMKEHPEVVIVKTFDAITNEPLFEVTVPRSIIVQNGSDKNRIKIDEQTNPDGNIFNFGSWSPTDSYLLEGKRRGYYDTLMIVNMIELFSVPRDTYEIDMLLMPKPELQVFVLERGSGEPVDDPTIDLQRIEAGEEIEKINSFISESGIARNSRLFPIELNTNYLASASKAPLIPSAQSASRLFYTVDDFKKVAGGRFKDTLYLTKLPSIPELVPDRTVPLYFENDRPKMGRIPEVPSEDYLSLYREYKSKQGRYVSRLEKSPLVGRADIIRMSRFFTRELEDFQRLDTLVDVFVQYMEAGYKVEIELRGYCSPIGNSDYNLLLSKRRIQCVQDLLEEYDNGVLQSYIKEGKFVITPNPKGEDEAPPTVREYLSDLNASIFSYLSSLERRVDIFLIPIEGID